QIKEMTRKVSAEVDLVHQQTQNQRYGSSHIGATAKDISNVVTDAASGVVDIFHGIDKAVADTWNNFWKDGKADSYQYFCVPEYGTANGRLHFHAVHFMRTLPTGSVDPNFGRRVRNRRQLNSLQNTWPYGYSMP